MLGKTFVHFAKHAMGIESAHSQASIPERETLAKVAKGKRFAVEIGVYEGATTRLIAENMAPDGQLFAIDPFIPGRLGICWGRYIAYRQVQRIRSGAKVDFVERFSYDAAKSIGGPFDLIFIDGDHSEEGIARDWAGWSDRVRAGGIIALHDTRVPAHNPNVANLGSHNYFEEHIRFDDRFELAGQVDSLSLIRRKEMIL